MRGTRERSEEYEAHLNPVVRRLQKAQRKRYRIGLLENYSMCSFDQLFLRIACSSIFYDLSPSFMPCSLTFSSFYSSENVGLLERVAARSLAFTR